MKKEKNKITNTRRDLTNSSFRCKNYNEVDMRGSWLDNSDFTFSRFSGADLRTSSGTNAIFCGANFSGADISRCDMKGATFRAADLTNANLACANLRYCDFRDADLTGVNLTGADLAYSCFDRAILSKTNFAGAITGHATFNDARLYGVKNAPFIPLICPEIGEFIGWKKCVLMDLTHVIVKLLITENAKRISGTTRKCRCSSAIVLEIQDLNGQPLPNGTRAFSLYRMGHGCRGESPKLFPYTVGSLVYPEEPFDEDRWNECSSGIHFFVTRQEAVDY